MIKTHRQEFSYTWQYKLLSAHSLPLGRFNENVLNRYVTMFTAGKPLTSHSLFKIYTKSGGNPLFAQELIKSLFDEKKMHLVNNRYSLIEGAETYLIPDTLYGLIAARIDSLSPELKSIIQFISIIGKEFSIEELEHLMPHETINIKDKILELQSMGIIREIF